MDTENLFLQETLTGIDGLGWVCKHQCVRKVVRIFSTIIFFFRCGNFGILYVLVMRILYYTRDREGSTETSNIMGNVSEELKTMFIIKIIKSITNE